MKKVLFTMFATILLILISAPFAIAQSVDGTWDVTLNTPGGERKFQATLKQSGESLTGTIGQFPITGSVKGSDVTIKYTVKYQDNDLPITMTGKLSGDSLKGDADFGGMAQGDWNAKKAAAASGSTASSNSSSSSSSASTAALAGEWSVTFSTPNGDVPSKFSIKQEGDSISGTASAPDGASVPIKGTVKGGSDFEIKYTIKYDGNDLPITMKGKINGAEIKGNADYGGLAEGDFKGKKN